MMPRHFLKFRAVFYGVSLGLLTFLFAPIDDLIPFNQALFGLICGLVSALAILHFGEVTAE